MKTTKLSALLLTGAMFIVACGNKQQKSEANVNENPTEEKIDVKAVEGRKNFTDQMVKSQFEACPDATIRYATKGLHFIIYDDWDWFSKQF